MNTARRATITTSNDKEITVQNTSSKLIRWSGLAAVVAGLIFAGIQPIHPPDVVASVNTSAWGIITALKTVMCLLFLLGIVGLYARQVNKVGWLGLAGYLLLSLSWALQTAFVFAEAFIMPALASTAPQFVNDYLGLARGDASTAALGPLPTLYSVVGLGYILGGLLFGVATLRAGILPRWAGGLLVVAAAVTPIAAVLPHQIGRFAAVPVALAFICLGYALWSERREQVLTPERVSSTVSPQLSHIAAE